MKQGKKPTASQKQVLSSMGLDPKQWSVLSWVEYAVTLQNKSTGETKHIDL